MENKPTEFHSILERVSIKGGLIGACASIYIHDEKLGKKFIVELSEMCIVEDYRTFLGDKLVRDINEYVLNSC